MVEPIRPSTLWLLPFSSIDRDHGCDAAASVLGSDRLRVIRRIGQDFFRSGDRASDRAGNRERGHCRMVYHGIVNVGWNDDTGQRTTMTFHEDANLRAANASVSVKAYESPPFAGTVVVSIAQQERSS